MKTNQKLLSGLGCCAMVLLSGTSAFGATLGAVGSVNNSYNAAGFQTGQGGEFYVQTTTTVPGPVNNSSYASTTRDQAGVLSSFQTFCLERTENLGGNNLRYTINDEAVAGGGNTHLPAGNQGGDRISAGTAWLYSRFALGILGVSTATLADNYAFSGTQAQRRSSAGLLQNAIWMLEDELTMATSNPFIALLLTVSGLGGAGFADIAAAQANANTGQNGVFVLNMHTTGGGLRQDMLWFEGGGNQVPEGGATVGLLGLALAALGLVARRKQVA